MYMYMHTYLHACTRTYLDRYIHTVHIITYMQTYIHRTFIHTHTNTHINVHTNILHTRNHFHTIQILFYTIDRQS